MKQFKILFLTLICAITFSACSDDDDATSTVCIPTGQADVEAYVINQGNSYSGIFGTVASYTNGGTYTDSLFYKANGMNLGATPQNAVLYGSKMYVSVYGSNLIWVLNRNTMAKVASITTQEPEYVYAAGGKVFITNNTGTVSRIDTTTLAIDKTTACGKNPVQMVATGDYLYVANSGYGKDSTVSKIRLSDFTKEKDIIVGKNPSGLVADSKGNVFACLLGDYNTVMPSVTKITTDDAVQKDFAKASLMAVKGTTLYLINSVTDWATYKTTNSYFSVNTETGATISSKLFATEAPFPTSIAIQPVTGDIFVTSDKPSSYGSASWSTPGSLFIYKADGTYVKDITTGVHPFAVLFNVK